MRNVSPHEITHIIRDLPGLVDTFCGGEFGNDQHYHRNYCVLHSVLTPQWVRVGGYCGPSNQPKPTQPHTVITGWHLMATENDNTERKMFALTLYAPFPRQRQHQPGRVKSQCQREENWKRTWNLMRRNWSLQIVSQQFLTFLNCLWFHPFFYNFSRCCLWVFTERVCREECGRTGNNIYSWCIIKMGEYSPEEGCGTPLLRPIKFIAFHVLWEIM